MPGFIKAYVRVVDALNRRIGGAVSYMIFAMMGVLLFAAIMRSVFNAPLIWAVEFSQFMMAAYYMLGGGYSLQYDAHVRMDAFYSRWRPRRQAFSDSLTAFGLIFYLILLLYGGWTSTLYSWETGQTNHSGWAPLVWPIKAVMTVGIVLMLLQAVAIFFRDLAHFFKRDLE